MKTKNTSIRLKPITKVKIERIYGCNLRQFLEAVLVVSENIPFLKNKIIKELENEK